MLRWLGMVMAYQHHLGVEEEAEEEAEVGDDPPLDLRRLT